MPMTIILAPDMGAGRAYAKANGYAREDHRIITPHPVPGRTVNATDIHIVGNPQFAPGELEPLMNCFLHSEEAWDVWQASREKLEELCTAQPN